jgi:hypothetical protein
MSLRPSVQFGRVQPGGSVGYHKVLSNHFLTDTQVSLSGASRHGFGVVVDPSSLIAHPGVTNTISITVTMPATSTIRCDTERVTAVSGGARPYTATAYLITISNTHRFVDLSDDHWASNPVQYLLSQQVISGYADGTFRPDGDVTRAQFAKVLVGAMGWDPLTPQTPTFNDVGADFWAYSYIETAAAYGVISGYDDGSFRPNKNVTRAQVAKMVVVSREWVMDTPASASFTDVSPTEWSYDYVETVNAAQVMSGYADNTFRPDAPASRAQIAKILTYSLFSDPSD